MAEDLSLKHFPISNLFSLPQSQGEWEALKLSDDQVSFYHDNGHLSGLQLLTDEQVDLLLQDLQSLTCPNHSGFEHWYEYHSNESKDPNTVLFHSLGAWRISKYFHDILWHPNFTVWASQLLAESGSAPVGVRFWHDQLFCKPAKHGGVVAWHQDYSYWTRTVPMQHLTFVKKK